MSEFAQIMNVAMLVVVCVIAGLYFRALAKIKQKSFESSAENFCNPKPFDQPENLTLIFLMLALVVLQLLMIASVISSTKLVIKLVAVNIVGLSLISHLFILARQMMNGRLRRSEGELAHWIFNKTEECRYQTLGEISGLVLHDLSAPMHVIDFCAKELQETEDSTRRTSYLERILRSSERAIALIQSFRNYLRNPDKPYQEFEFGDAHTDVLRILESQFAGKKFGSVKISLSADVATLRLNFFQPDLIHVLLNLYENSLQNLLDNSVPNPEISVVLDKTLTRGEYAAIQVRDNGTGLKPAEFEELTAFAYLPVHPAKVKKGLGLRLIRRLVERGGGELSMAQDQPEQGSCFVLRLKTLEGGTDGRA
jgi:signal transduction histidine kinase